MREVRLAKAWNKQFDEPGLSSFNIEALALECIDGPMPIREALTEWFDYSAEEVKKGDTKDPANVSPPIKLLLDRDKVVNRLELAAGHMRNALDNDDDEEKVREELAKVFPKYVKQVAWAGSKAALAAALGPGNEGFNRAGVYVGVAAATKSLKTTRSHGDGEVW